MQRRERVDRECDRFEQEFNAGEEPRTEDFLDRADASDRPLLLAQLLRLEMDLQRRAGRPIDADRYRRRFPDALSIVDTALESAFQRQVLAPSMDTTVGGRGDEESRDSALDLASLEEVLQQQVELDVLQSIARKYNIDSCLGVGGFAVVCLARDKDLDREVALKIPRKGRLATDDQRDLFVAEARRAAQLDHPGIVRVHAVHREPDFVYIVQELITGGDLAQSIARQRPSHRRAAEVLVAIADAVGYLHQQRCTHLDLKPSNILLDEEGNPYLADFGLTVHEETQRQLAGARMGTWAYMSPEQVRGELHRLDGRSDIWSLGVILYELLVGNRPFRADNRDELEEQIQFLDPRPPRQLDPAVSAELSRICLKCLDKRATDRYQAAADLIDDLRHWLDRPPGEPAMKGMSGSTASSQPPRWGEASSETEALPAIVPKGLRSFDAADADFFLQLLPGPFDREGLPKGVRFWKTAVERRGPDTAFPVGLMYGPSGCGKSSLVKAGLIPRLDSSILPVYVEATADDTEVRLLKALRRHCTELDPEADLPELIAALRTQGGSRGRKVLLVLDQFE